MRVNVCVQADALDASAATRVFAVLVTPQAQCLKSALRPATASDSDGGAGGASGWPMPLASPASPGIASPPFSPAASVDGLVNSPSSVTSSRVDITYETAEALCLLSVRFTMCVNWTGLDWVCSVFLERLSRGD